MDEDKKEGETGGTGTGMVPWPSIGRVVVYNHPGSADGKFPPKQSPAIIQKVNVPVGDNPVSVELFVMSVYGGIFFNHEVEQGDGPSQWNWPTRV